MFQGPLNPQWAQFPDLSARERWVFGPAVALMFVVGVGPQILIRLFNATVLRWVTHLLS